MSSSPYAPDEPAHIISDEVAWLQGAFVGSLLCGVQITLSTLSFLAVLKQRIHRRLRVALLVYIFLLCAIMTAGQQTSLMFVQTGFIESQNYPGGPNGYLSYRYSTAVDVASTSLFVFANWMMESLLVWRCKVVCCTGDRPVWFGVVFPSVLLVAEYVTGALFLREMLQGRDIPGLETTLHFATAYASLSLLLNVTVTAIIAVRLLLHRRRMVRQFGAGHGSHYASAVTIVIESASLYTAFLILVIVFFAVASSASNILQQAVAQVEAITSLMIIYRIAQGKGWKYEAGVSTGDWRGDQEAQVEHVEHPVVHLQRVSDPEATRTDSGVRAPSILSKEDETPTALSASSVAPTLSQDEGA
ncbi:hypothetical protein OG21DRAFT_1414227 [Imleria badia]|nr:hypothetical protein OG21DRAFT_1414227 [Imleria badia]